MLVADCHWGDGRKRSTASMVTAVSPILRGFDDTRATATLVLHLVVQSQPMRARSRSPFPSSGRRRGFQKGWLDAGFDLADLTRTTPNRPRMGC